MAIDLSQFHQVFFEESFEGLDVMESALMALDPDNIDSEIVNSIFRSAHSIKGGSATFGFSNVASFTHILETLLDLVREGKRGLSVSDVNLLLTSVDCMREMLSQLQGGDDGVTEQSKTLTVKFSELLNEGASGDGAEGDVSADNAEPDVVDSEDESTGEVVRWSIQFAPEKGILKTGNDPFRIFRELSDLGELKCEACLDTLVGISSMDSELCYLSWSLTLDTAEPRSVIDSIFEWVIDESDLTIELVDTSAQQEVEGIDGIDEQANDTQLSAWNIVFIPHENVLLTGNDPVKMFRYLQDLGTLSVSVDLASLPSFSGMNSESCYLAWELQLQQCTASEADIHEVFEWVRDEADIEIRAISLEKPPVAASKSLQVQAANDKASTAPSMTEQPPVKESAEKTTDKAVAAPDNVACLDSARDQRDGFTKQEKPAKVASPARSGGVAAGENSSIRVGIDKVDNLINMVGELVITQSMLGQLGNDFDLDKLPKLIEGLSQLEQNTRELQESVMRIRMLPISFAFSRFPRMVRDLSQALNKTVHLEMSGENTELDKTVMEKIGDPLVHIVRNAVDHGIETPDIRAEAGKNETGTVILNAYHQSGNVVIEVIDDGKGLNARTLIEKAVEKGLFTEAEAESVTEEQAFDLIFQPGFSTASVVSDISGRGVGMDVVKRNIQALNGVVELKSELGKGSKVTIRLPLTLAILDGQLVRVGTSTYIFPLVSIVESIQCKREFVNSVAGGCDVFKLRDDYVPIIRLADVFHVKADNRDIDNTLMVVVESEGEKVGIVVDELLAQQQVVIKSLERNYRRVEGVSGATILGDGTVALILDMPGIVELAGDSYREIENDRNSFVAQ